MTDEPERALDSSTASCLVTAAPAAPPCGSVTDSSPAWSVPWQSAAVRREGAREIAGDVIHRCPCHRQGAGEVEKGVRAALVLQVGRIHAVLPETTRVPPGIIAQRVETGTEDERRRQSREILRGQGCDVRRD